jgi:hypothetical protein
MIDRFKECEYKEKYEKMGITPKELFLRQQGLCWLELAFDDEGEKKIPGELYCTDGKEYSPTSHMLNPTLECMECVKTFLFEREYNRMFNAKVNKLIVSLLIASNRDKPEFHMSRQTFDVLEDYINNTTLFSDETKPIKVTASGGLYMFNAVVTFVNEMEEGFIAVRPGNEILKVYDAKPSDRVG